MKLAFTVLISHSIVAFHTLIRLAPLALFAASCGLSSLLLPQSSPKGLRTTWTGLRQHFSHSMKPVFLIGYISCEYDQIPNKSSLRKERFIWTVWGATPTMVRKTWWSVTPCHSCLLTSWQIREQREQNQTGTRGAYPSSDPTPSAKPCLLKVLWMSKVAPVQACGVCHLPTTAKSRSTE